MCIIINQGTTEQRFWQVSGTELTYPLIGATAKIASASIHGQVIFTQSLDVNATSRLLTMNLLPDTSSAWNLSSLGDDTTGTEIDESGVSHMSSGKYMDYQIEVTHSDGKKSRLEIPESYFIVSPEFVK